MAPKPMPTHDQDPDFNAARDALQAYNDAVQTIRSDYRASDLDKAERIDTAYKAYVLAVQEAFARLHDRRRVRLEHLESLLPIGPGIPDGTSPADSAVLMAAFRAAYDKAMSTDRPGRAQLLADAERWDDDAARRGTLTAITEVSEWWDVKEWAELHLDGADVIGESMELRDLLAGGGHSVLRGFQRQVFAILRAPQEVRNLPTLQAAQARQVETLRRTQAAPRRT
ncbi:hypothetical protein ACIBM4_14270 [Streptomyces sp. NPDC050256]|uniref:hypothetical protein n=1 Tax=Streptomyces sp. NPDC050256 TaxID=3365607 RepID=UPI0037B1C561